MKRRTFIISASTVAVGIPVAYYLTKHKWRTGNPLSMPDMLSNFCKEEELKAMGIKYREMVPAESEKQKLTDLLLTDNNGKKIRASNTSLVETTISDKIRGEFNTNNTILVNGWVITVTEARQCALFSLTKN
jgi:hypothetical protein